MATKYEVRAGAILRRLDRLRDARYLGRISEDDYHAGSERLWDELRRCDREAREAAEKGERLRREREEEKRRKQLDKERRSRTALCCDGCYEEGRAGIGVVTRDGTIHISEEVGAATTNQAECLSVVRGLKECRKLGHRPAAVLSDSRLVVCWVDGTYAANSDTARKYTPQIRKLLEEVGTSLRWIPGAENLADRPSREAIGVWRDPTLPTLQVARSTPADKLRFRDLAGLKSGRDRYSKLRLPALSEMVDAEARRLVEAEFREEDRARVYRWMLRGLPVAAAVRKVKVDLEIAENARGRARKRRGDWDDLDEGR
jgi:ribonuclease HI